MRLAWRRRELSSTVREEGYTTEDFYDDKRRALLNDRWQGPPTYRLLIPKALHQHLLESEAAARSRTWRDKNETRRSRSHPDEEGPSLRERERRQAQSNAAALAALYALNPKTTWYDGAVRVHRSRRRSR